ncbi:beta-(1-6) glucans synthase, partial [Rhodopseudomonas sp. WA056]|nr:beta-(1-6) glucans synthase [Rhodopseudomonas sp. WA056]
PLFLLMALNRPQQGPRPIAEASFAGLFAACALYIVFNEGPKNWQSLWTCAVYALLALTLWRARVAKTPA